MHGARSSGLRALWQLPQLLPLPRLRLRRLGAGPLAGGQLRLTMAGWASSRRSSPIGSGVRDERNS